MTAAAFRRSPAEFLVFVEENYKAKSLIYRWKPRQMCKIQDRIQIRARFSTSDSTDTRNR